MPEITDKDLAEIRANLTSCSPLVQSLVERLDRVEGEKDMWHTRIESITSIIGDAQKQLPADGRALLYNYEKVKQKNTALRERVKRMEEALQYVKNNLYADDFGDWALYTDFELEVVEAALNEGE